MWWYKLTYCRFQSYFFRLSSIFVVKADTAEEAMDKLNELADYTEECIRLHNRKKLPKKSYQTQEEAYNAARKKQERVRQKLEKKGTNKVLA